MIPKTGLLRLKLFTILWLVVLLSHGLAQAPDGIKTKDNIVFELPDIVRTQLESVLQKEQAVKSIFPLLASLSRRDPPVALYLIEQLLAGAAIEPYEENWAKLVYYKNWITLEDYAEDESLETLHEQVEQCLVFFQKQKSFLWEIRCYNLLSNISYNLSYNNDDSLYLDALRYNQKALSFITDEALDTEEKYNLFGEAYRIQGNICLAKKDCSLDTTLTSYDQGLEYYTLTRDESGQANLLLNKAIAFAAMEWKNPEVAPQEDPIPYYQRALQASQQANDLQKVRLSFAIYLQNKYKQTRDRIWCERSNVQLQAILDKAQRKKSAAYFQLAVNTQNFLSYEETSLTEAEQDQYLDTIIHFYKETFIAAKAENNLKVYNEIFNRLTILCPYFPTTKCSELLQLADRVKTYFIQKNKAINQEITQLNEDFRIKIEAGKRANERQWYIIIGVVVAAIVTSLFFWQKNKNLQTTVAIKEEALQAKEEALRAQMNPHFISNTINAIESLVNQKRNDEASDYLIDFSRLCRLVINHSRENEISLQAEMDTLRYFLSLEELRLSGDFEYHIHVDPQLDAHCVVVPPLLLQPFVENAIWHGIKNKEEPKKGVLNIEVCRGEDQTIAFMVEDNGVGRKRARELQQQSLINRKSWGMTLMEERIKHFQRGAQTGIEWIDLYDDQQQARGTKVVVTLPEKTKKRDA